MTDTLVSWPSAKWWHVLHVADAADMVSVVAGEGLRVPDVIGTCLYTNGGNKSRRLWGHPAKATKHGRNIAQITAAFGIRKTPGDTRCQYRRGVP